MSELHWGIKETFVAYVRRMPDGHIGVDAGAHEPHSGTFAYPSAKGEAASTDEVDRFMGGVTFTGHHGMLYLEIREPWIEQRGEARILSIADDDEPGGRLDFATLTRTAESTIEHGETWSVTLTAGGAELFFGNYAEGTPLDPLTLRRHLRAEGRDVQASTVSGSTQRRRGAESAARGDFNERQAARSEQTSREPQPLREQTSAERVAARAEQPVEMAH